MKNLSKNISLLAVSVFALGVVAVVPVSARSSADDTMVMSTAAEDSGSASSGSSTGSASGSGRKGIDAKQSSNSGDKSRFAHAATDDSPTSDSSILRERAEKLVAAERAAKASKPVEQRQKSCETRKASLLKKSTKYSENAAKHLEKFTAIYSKVQAFQATKQLAVPNYDSLKSAADAKKGTVESAVKALADAGAAIDCTAQDPAAGVATLKAAVSNARSALHEYRLAIKDVAVALKTAAATKTGNSPTEAN